MIEIAPSCRPDRVTAANLEGSLKYGLRFDPRVLELIKTTVDDPVALLIRLVRTEHNHFGDPIALAKYLLALDNQALLTLLAEERSAARTRKGRSVSMSYGTRIVADLTGPINDRVYASLLAKAICTAVLNGGLATIKTLVRSRNELGNEFIDSLLIEIAQCQTALSEIRISALHAIRSNYPQIRLGSNAPNASCRIFTDPAALGEILATFSDNESQGSLWALNGPPPAHTAVEVIYSALIAGMPFTRATSIVLSEERQHGKERVDNMLTAVYRNAVENRTEILKYWAFVAPDHLANLLAYLDVTH